jgi:hypothetical protein
MNKADTSLAFHDHITEVLADLAADDDGPDEYLREAMGDLTDILLESLDFTVTGDGVAEIRLK